MSYTGDKLYKRSNILTIVVDPSEACKLALGLLNAQGSSNRRVTVVAVGSIGARF